jgi:hypothetical protein
VVVRDCVCIDLFDRWGTLLIVPPVRLQPITPDVAIDAHLSWIACAAGGPDTRVEVYAICYTDTPSVTKRSGGATCSAGVWKAGVSTGDP